MLLSNALDKNFQAMILPLYMLDYIYLQPKFQINRAFVTPNGIPGKLYCLLGVLIVIVMNIMNLFTITTINGDNKIEETSFKITLADTVFYSVAGVLVWAMNTVQSDRNVQVILKMQSSYRTLQNAGGLREYQKYNWIFMTSVFLLYFLYNLLYAFFDIYKPLHLVYNMVLFYFDVNIIVAVRIVKFLEYELRLWRKELYGFQKTCSKTNHLQLMKYLTNAGYKEKSLFKAYSDILSAFKLCSTIFGMSIIVLVVEGFGHPLIYIQFLIDYSVRDSNKSTSKLIFMVSLVWIVKTFVLLSCLCVTCQQFYLSVAESEAASAAILAQDVCLEHVRRLCKNACRLGACVRAREALRVGRALAVDATTPLRLFALLGNYTVVLLQFAFL